METNNKNNDTATQRRLLTQVLIINLFFFFLEIITGFIANSMGLVADSLDMLADAIVYSLSLFVVGKAMTYKKTVAKASGYFQLILALIGFIEVIRRFIDVDRIPHFQTMIIISLLALLGNAISLYLLHKSKNNEAHMEASKIFTSNDVIVNIGVIIAGALVFITNSKFPDLIIGIIVFFIVAKGAIRILRISKKST